MDDRLLGRIKKMLRLANDKGATEGERDNAMRMAHKLLAKHNLDVADLESVDTGQEKKASEPRMEEKTQFYGRPWARNVCASIAELMFCRYLYLSAKKATDVHHYFIGKHSNAVTAALLAEFVVTSIMREGKKRQRAEHENNRWWREFCWGAAHKVKERVRALREETKDQKAKTPGTAIVLADVYRTEDTANALWIQQKYPALRRGRGGKGYSQSEAYSQGQRYGNTVSLNTQVK